MSTASSSTSTLTDRPEAEPLPKKVGEIGYVPPKSPKTPESRHDSPVNHSPLPARHPADRTDNVPATESSTTTPPPAANPNPSPNPNATSSSTSSVKKSWRQRLSVGGVSFFSIFRIVILLIFIAATGAAWGITIRLFGKNIPAQPDTSGDSGFGSGSDDNSDSNNSGNQGPSNFSSVVIVQVSFTVVTLVELLFLERSIFHARAERYLYKNGMSRGGASAAMGIAPWNRPSLPTYAAALAESGRGTGDVEDNLIAIPPPPAYGNTRGSVLLLSGFLRDSLVRNLNRSSQQSANSHNSHSITPREMEEGRSRPISYDASEEVDNAKRAFELEAALSRLESRGHDSANHS